MRKKSSSSFPISRENKWITNHSNLEIILRPVGIFEIFLKVVSMKAVNWF